MKKLGFLILAIAVIGYMTGCKAPKPVKTIENLKAAYNGESTASAKYAAFAVKAKEEGFDTIAKMFEATSKAEAIHADNHKKVLEKLGEKVEAASIGAFEVKTTMENLMDAAAGETYEIDSMYPSFIKIAEEEKSADAKKSFTWAWDTEKKHKEFYIRAHEAIMKDGEKSLPVQWFVCPVCGNTYDLPTVKDKCDFCMTAKEKFFVF
jgi:rubrerythrin